MNKSTTKRAFLGFESLERRELLSGTTISSIMPALTAPPTQSTGTTAPVTTSSPTSVSMPFVDTAYLLVPSQVSSGTGSSAPVTYTPIQILVPPEVFSTPGTNGSTTQPGEAPITLQFHGLTGPVDVQLNSDKPQAVATFLDYVESGAFNNAVFARLGLGTSSSSSPAVSEATVNKNGSLTLTGGATLTLLPSMITEHPTTLKFEFATSAGTAGVQLNGAKTPQTVATFMDYIESGAFEKALIQRISSDHGTGGSMGPQLQASVIDKAIVLSDGGTESGESILLKNGALLDLTPETQSDGSSIYQINYTIADNNQHTNDTTNTLIDDILVNVADYNNSIFGLSSGEQQNLQDRLDVLQERIERLENRVNNELAALGAAAAAGDIQGLGTAIQQLGNTLNSLGAAQSAAAAGAAVLAH